MSKVPGTVTVGGKTYLRKSSPVYSYMSPKHIAFLERVRLEKNHGSISKTIVMIVEGYQKLYARTTRDFLEMEGPKRGIENRDLFDIVVDIMKDLQRGVITGDRLDILVKAFSDLKEDLEDLRKELREE